MRAVIQRVSQATVSIDGQICSRIGNGLVTLVAVEETDTDADIEWLSGKIVRLRVFSDDQGVMNLSVVDISGEILVISQFTLLASTRKGNRPSYSRPAPPAVATGVYERFVRRLESDLGKPVGKGRFGAHMEVNLTNDGPVTIIIDSNLRE